MQTLDQVKANLVFSWVAPVLQQFQPELRPVRSVYLRSLPKECREGSRVLLPIPDLEFLQLPIRLSLGLARTLPGARPRALNCRPPSRFPKPPLVPMFV